MLGAHLTGNSQKGHLMSTESSAEKSAINGIRTALGVGGVLAIIAGIFILVWPAKTRVRRHVVIAIYAVAAGLVYAGWHLPEQRRLVALGHIALGRSSSSPASSRC